MRPSPTPRRRLPRPATRRSSGKATKPAATSATVISRSCTTSKPCRRTVSSSRAFRTRYAALRPAGRARWPSSTTHCWRAPMHFEQLDLNLLVALDALLTERSITAAGVRVHLTQSAMSGALSRLREFFNDELLTQVGRKMVPTPLGESLAEPVRQILLQVRATINTKPGFDPATSARHFSVMMSDYVDTVLMSEVLRRAEAVAPRVRFNLVSNDARQSHRVPRTRRCRPAHHAPRVPVR